MLRRGARLCQLHQRVGPIVALFQFEQQRIASSPAGWFREFCSVGRRESVRHSSTAASVVSRRPSVRDLVKLNPSLGLTSLKGLVAGHVVKITQDQTSADPTTPYQVRLESADMVTHPWFKEDELVLADPIAPWPKPEAPENCCGSSCPNCVWIRYQAECDEWTKSTGGVI